MLDNRQYLARLVRSAKTSCEDDTGARVSRISKISTNKDGEKELRQDTKRAFGEKVEVK